MKKHLDWKRIIISIICGGLLLLLVSASILHALTSNTTIGVVWGYIYAFMVISLLIIAIIKNMNFFYHNGEDKK